jgi:hypothetical protein
MMPEWSLSRLLGNLHQEIEQKLRIARQGFSHAPTMGDASESVWIKMLSGYLPERYQIASGHIVDSAGQFSDQIDIIIFDRQYSPFIFSFENKKIIPAESVYAVIECKQAINQANVTYALQKALSVRKLTRTSIPITHAGGVYPAKVPMPILAGLLCFESDWNPPLGTSLIEAIKPVGTAGYLNLGCVAAHGIFYYRPSEALPTIVAEGKPATAFLLQLISQLQRVGTVPMIDIEAYAQWLSE